MLAIELVGPAGAGKTTLFRLLMKNDNSIFCGNDISFRNKQHFPVFLRYAPAVLPFILPRPSSRGFTWDEIKSIVYLEGWIDILRSQAKGRDGILLLDQGPVFRLALLYGFGPKCLREPSYQRWWDERFAQWARFLNVIVWLDAPNLVLKDRINTREKDHMVKGKPPEEASQFLLRFRAAYAHVFEQLTKCGGPKFMQFDTSKMPIEEVLKSLMLTYQAGLDGH